METFTRAVGRRQGDDRILDAADAVAMPFEVDEFPELEEEYWSFNGRGVEFLFARSTLATIFFHVEPETDDPGLGVWDEPLIDGLPPACTVDQARARLGAPVDSGQGDRGSWHRFALNEATLHLDFNASTCRLATLTRDA